MNTNTLRMRNSLSKHRLKPAVSVILMGILTACSDAGINEMGPQASGPQTASNTTTPGAISPSQSAAELTNDNTLTVQTALAIEAQTDTQNQAPIDAPAAALPAIISPVSEAEAVVTPELTVQPVTETDTGNESDTQDSESITSEISDTTDEQEPPTAIINSDIDAENPTDNRDVVDIEDSNEAVVVVDAEDSNEQDPINRDVDADNLPDDRDLVDAENLAETHFVSVSTPGFEGDVLEDAIKITWPETATARGYNVYKQADYLTTVFDTEFVDTEVFDDDYYYEIQAFDNDDTLWYVATGLTVSARTLGKTDPDAPQAKENLLEDYELVFSDEFNNTELDTTKWNTSFLWGTDLFINNEQQYYVDIARDPDFGFNPFTFDGQNLTITTIETPPELSEKAKNQPYLSGIITSYDAFKFTYGYAETRAKFTHGRGYWPAFWLLNAYYVDAKPEIDIMEFIGHNQDVIYHTYHYFDSEGELRSTESYPIPGIDFTADFHTFGVEWMPGTLIFYVDGIETYKIVDINVSQQEMYVIANQAVGGWWAGPPDETTPFPGDYMIDYIRIYQRTTPYEIIEFDQPDDLIPLFVDSPGKVIPNKRPSIELWPEGYPDGR